MQTVLRWAPLLLVAACGGSQSASVTAPSPADPTSAAEAERTWTRWIEADDLAQAKQRCAAWTSSSTAGVAAEGHKCLANVEAAGDSAVRIDPDGRGGGTLGPGFRGPGAEKAIGHLDRAIALVPNDLSAHMGRLHLLIASGRATEAPAYLEKSLATYRGPDALETWLAYIPRLADVGALEATIAFLRVIERRYPNEHRIIGNIGALSMEVGRVQDGLPLLRRAVELAPEDSIDNFNLGRALEKTNDLAGAEARYRKAVQVETDPQRKRGMRYKLGLFLHERGQKREEACVLQRESCPEDTRPACVPAKPSSGRARP